MRETRGRGDEEMREMGRWGGGEMGSRGAGEQRRVFVQVLSPLPLCPYAPYPVCPMPHTLFAQCPMLEVRLDKKTVTSSYWNFC